MCIFFFCASTMAFWTLSGSLENLALSSSASYSRSSFNYFSLWSSSSVLTGSSTSTNLNKSFSDYLGLEGLIGTVTIFLRLPLKAPCFTGLLMLPYLFRLPCLITILLLFSWSFKNKCLNGSSLSNLFCSRFDIYLTTGLSFILSN